MKETPTTYGTRIHPFPDDPQLGGIYIQVLTHNPPSIGLTVGSGGPYSPTEARQLIEALERALTSLCDANP